MSSERAVLVSVSLAQIGGRGRCEPQSNRFEFAGWYGELIIGSRFGARQGGIHRVAISADNKFVDAILHIGSAVLAIEQSLVVGFVFGEKQLRLAFAIK